MWRVRPTGLYRFEPEPAQGTKLTTRSCVSFLVHDAPRKSAKHNASCRSHDATAVVCGCQRMLHMTQLSMVSVACMVPDCTCGVALACMLMGAITSIKSFTHLPIYVIGLQSQALYCSITCESMRQCMSSLPAQSAMSQVGMLVAQA